jgi:hypothetical protein
VDTTSYRRLRFLFGSFFHQDWDTEGDDWPDLVNNYAGGSRRASWRPPRRNWTGYWQTSPTTRP